MNDANRSTNSRGDSSFAARRRSDQVGFSDVVATLRRYRWSFLILTTAIIYFINMVALMREPEGPQYHAEALVVAAELEIRVDSFPRTAVAIFNGGTVARLASERAGTGILPEDLIPEIVTVQPVENTGVVEIDAVHSDPELAALYANVVGQALAEELNRVGPGLGSFALQIDATVPTAPLERSRLPMIVLSLLAAALLTTGVAALVAFVREQKEGSPASRREQAFDETSASGLNSAEERIVEVEIGIVSNPDDVASSAVAEPVASSAVDEPVASSAEDEPVASSAVEERANAGSRSLQTENDRRRRGPLPHMISSHVEAAEIVEAINGVGPAFGARLATAGVNTLSKLAQSSSWWLSQVIDIRRDVAADWIDQAKQLIEPDDSQAAGH